MPRTASFWATTKLLQPRLNTAAAAKSWIERFISYTSPFCSFWDSNGPRDWAHRSSADSPRPAAANRDTECSWGIELVVGTKYRARSNKRGHSVAHEKIVSNRFCRSEHHLG